MNNYVGMNFKKWCSLDIEDEKIMNISLHIDNVIKHYSSNDEISRFEMIQLQDSTITSIELKNNEWFIELCIDNC